MKIKSLIFLFFFLLLGCKSKLKMVIPTPAGIHFISEKKPQYLTPNTALMETPILDKKYKNVLVIYYDKTTDTKKIFKFIKQQKGVIAERYESFSAVAVSFPEGKSLGKISRKLSKLQGIIAIQQIENQH